MESRSSRVVKNFFDVLLDEPSKNVDIESQPLAKLLEKVVDENPEVDVIPEIVDTPKTQESKNVNLESNIEQPAPMSAVEEVPLVITEEKIQPQVKETVKTIEPDIEIESKIEVERDVENSPSLTNTLDDELEEGFPVLFFEAMGQTFSVPLVKLKGIYRKKSLSKLIGKPKWFSGVQIERDEKLNVIDTALYLMPEKYGESLEYSPNYQYIIVIGSSNWGLSCDRLIDSTTLSHDEIKWRTDTTRSPWLAGTVKHRMCGLLAVDALIELFENNETK